MWMDISLQNYKVFAAYPNKLGLRLNPIEYEMAKDSYKHFHSLSVEFYIVLNYISKSVIFTQKKLLYGMHLLSI